MYLKSSTRTVQRVVCEVLPTRLLKADASPRVTSSTDPGGGLDTNGNCNHVEVDLNSLNIFEKEILMVSPSSVATSMCTTKYFPGIGRNKQ